MEMSLTYILNSLTITKWWFSFFKLISSSFRAFNTWYQTSVEVSKKITLCHIMVRGWVCLVDDIWEILNSCPRFFFFWIEDYLCMESIMSLANQYLIQTTWYSIEINYEKITPHSSLGALLSPSNPCYTFK